MLTISPSFLFKSMNHTQRPSIDDPIPRATTSCLLHNLHSARPMFSTWSTADHYRRRLLLAPPSPTAHSAVFQPVAVATSTGTAAAAFALGGGSDSEVTRVSLWAELKDAEGDARGSAGAAECSRDLCDRSSGSLCNSSRWPCIWTKRLSQDTPRGIGNKIPPKGRHRSDVVDLCHLVMTVCVEKKRGARSCGEDGIEEDVQSSCSVLARTLQRTARVCIRGQEQDTKTGVHTRVIPRAATGIEQEPEGHCRRGIHRRILISKRINACTSLREEGHLSFQKTNLGKNKTHRPCIYRCHVVVHWR